MDNKKYYRYQLTYPYEGSKIYKSSSLDKAIKKCYSEFKNLNEHPDGIFSVTNIDTKNEYNFQAKVSNDTVQLNKTQFGGLHNQNYVTDKLLSLKRKPHYKPPERINIDIEPKKGPQKVNIDISPKDIPQNYNVNFKINMDDIGNAKEIFCENEYDECVIL